MSFLATVLVVVGVIVVGALLLGVLGMVLLAIADGFKH